MASTAALSRILIVGLGSIGIRHLANLLEVRGNDGITRRLSDTWTRNDLFLDAMEHFLACVRERRSTRIPLDDDIRILSIALDIRSRNLRAGGDAVRLSGLIPGEQT